MANAGVHHAQRAFIKQALCQLLRSHVTGRIEACCEFGGITQIVKIGTEVSQQGLITDAVLEIIDLSVFNGFMKDDFGQSGLDVKCAIPGAPLPGIESTALGTGIGKSRIYDTEIRYTEHELVYADAGQAAALCPEPLIGSVIERKKVCQVIGAFGQWR